MAALPSIEAPSNERAPAGVEHVASARQDCAPSASRVETRDASARYEVLAMLDAHAQQHPLNRALVMADAGKAGSVNYAELARKVRGLSERMSLLYPGGGARIAVLSESCPAWGMVALAALASNQVLVPLDITMEPEALVRALRRVQPAMIFCAADQLAIARESIEQGAPGADVVRFDRCVADVTLPPTAATREADGGAARATHSAILAFTSGTTSTPKVVEIGFDRLLFQIRALTACFALRPSDRLLSILPMHHMLELTAGFLCPLWAGAEIHYLTSLVPDDALRRIRCHGLTRAVTVPAWLALLKKTFELGARAHGSVTPATLRAHARRQLGPDFEHFVSGGAPLADGVAEYFETAGVPVIQGYGLTETSPVVATNTRARLRRGSVGRPLSGTETIIAANGEILVRGPHVAERYQLEDGGSATLTDTAGWFHTGDLGRMDSDGFLYVTGRIKTTIVLANGKNVQPEEIEGHLEAFDGLAESGVVALHDASRGDEICLVAVPAGDIVEEDGPRLAERIRRALASLAPHKRPRHVLLRQQPLPRTAAGKLLRCELADWASKALRS